MLEFEGMPFLFTFISPVIRINKFIYLLFGVFECETLLDLLQVDILQGTCVGGTIIFLMYVYIICK